MNNKIIKEVRDARAALAEEHNFDRKKIYEWAKEAHNTRNKMEKKLIAEKSDKSKKIASLISK